MCVCVCVCVCVQWGGGGASMVGNHCPKKYWAYNFICGESVCGYGNVLQGSGQNGKERGF